MTRLVATTAARLGLSLLLVLLGACGSRADLVTRQQSYVFGTLVDITIAGVPPERAKALAGSVFAEFDRLHRLLHPWQPGPMADLNAALASGDAVLADPEIVSVIWDAIPYEQQSDHLFNPAIGKLVALWGFHSDAPRGEIPEQKAVQQIAQGAPRLTDLIVEGNRVSSRNPAVQLDFGGYAKGYALDRARALLRVAGIGAGGSGALINIGGNLIALGHKNGEAWRVGIQHPRAPRAMATLELRDGEAIGTSGDYQRYFERDGRRYSHIIDPRTGMPAQGMQSVSVLIAPGPQSGAASDAASKPLFVAGPEAWADAARRIGVSRALVVTAAGQACATPEMAARLSWEDRSAKLAVIP